VRHFVNRKPQLDLFAQRLAPPGQAAIIFVHGTVGIGKSALLQKLRAEHCRSGVTYAWLDFQNDELFTPQAVIDRLSEQIGGAFLTAISDAGIEIEKTIGFAPADLLAGLGRAPNPAPALHIETNVGEVGERSAVAVGAGINQFIHSPINITAGMDWGRLQTEKLRRLNETVQMAIAALAAHERVFLFFDACDAAPQDVLKWLHDLLLIKVRDQRLPASGSFVVVLAGNLKGARGHWLHTLADWHNDQTVHVNELSGLHLEDVREYWSVHRQLLFENLPALLLTMDVPPHLLVGLADLEQLRGGARG
jgi:hypothetical protein